MTEKLLNSSVKKPLGESPNTLIFGNAINQEPVEIKDIDQQNNTVTPKSIRAYVDKFMHRQSKLLWQRQGRSKRQMTHISSDGTPTTRPHHCCDSET